MKKLPILMLGGVFAMAACSNALAARTTDADAPNIVVPVLVHVNAAGDVTEVEPSSTLSPRLNRLMKQNLDEMIVEPAMYKGRAIASQFVVNLRLELSARQQDSRQQDSRQQDSYDAKFVYVSSTPMPAGNWHWLYDNTTDRLALVDSSLRDTDPRLRHRQQTRFLQQPIHQHHGDGGMPNEPAPPTQNASMGAARSFHAPPMQRSTPRNARRGM